MVFLPVIWRIVSQTSLNRYVNNYYNKCTILSYFEALWNHRNWWQMLFQSLWWIIFDDGCNIPFPKQRDRIKGEEAMKCSSILFRGSPHKSKYVPTFRLISSISHICFYIISSEYWWVPEPESQGKIIQPFLLPEPDPNQTW